MASETSIFTSDEMERQIFCTVIHVLYFERSKNPNFYFCNERKNDAETTCQNNYAKNIAPAIF